MSDITKVASAVNAKTARACDGCILKRARWFCAADDAFLCQSCDSRVHSANPVARRHERVRLKYASSFRSLHPDHADHVSEINELTLLRTRPTTTRVPLTWRSRKARTPRGKQQNSDSKSPATSGSEEEIVLVKSMSNYLVPDEVTNSFDECESDGQLLYSRVPIFDSFSTELCTSMQHEPETKNNKPNANTSHGRSTACFFDENEMKGFVGSFYNDVGFVPSDMDLEEFAADVESLLGKGLDSDESFGMDGIGLVDGSMDMTSSIRCGRVKDEVEIEMANESFELNFDYNDDEKVEGVLDDEMIVTKKSKTLLRLDYESILCAWDGSVPWAKGTRPEVDPNECWPTCLATCQIESHQQHLVDHATCLKDRLGLSRDGGREARVSRYKEKRRTRLFSKKIRYEVRKLNAEKRPRMKGRFVKRPSDSLFS